MSDDQPSSSNQGGKDEKSKKRKFSESSDAVNIPSTSGETPQLPTWVAGGSPARFVAPDDLLKMSVAMDNLALVHEIAINPNFEVPTTPSNPIEAAIKEQMHKAYWDLLKEDLAKDPPVFEHAFNLLMEIKKTIHDDILMSRHVRLHSELNVILDENSIRNEMEQGALDVKALAKSVLELMGRICAPERDEMIAKLKDEEDVVTLIKEIFAILDVMKADLTNFVISQNRSVVEDHSAKLEYKAFQTYLENFPDGSRLTKEWLRKAYDSVYPPVTGSSEQSAKKEKKEVNVDEEMNRTTSRGYLNLVQTENPDPFPETFRIDKVRLRALAEKFLQMTLTTSAVFVTCNIAGKKVSESEGFKKQLKDHLILITNDIEEKSLSTTLSALIEQCVKEVDERSASLGQPFPDERKELLRSQLKGVADSGNAVRLLVLSRMSRFVEEMLCSPTEVPHRLLPGLSVIERELCGFTARVLRLCVHNRKTFVELYQNLLMDIRAERELAS